MGAGDRFIELQESADAVRMVLAGEWRMRSISRISAALTRLASLRAGRRIILDGRALEEIDTAGALLLLAFLQDNGRSLKDCTIELFSEKHASIIRLVEQANIEALPLAEEGRGLGILGDIGHAGIEALNKTLALLSFIGEAGLALFRALTRPRTMRFRELVNQIELVCIDALPIVSLVTALIGVVVAYLFATQIEQYGANIFIVDGVATAMWRELSPIIVAIIVAGRSGSAFTAQIGTMKLNEEIDAMRTLGLSPMQVIVLPRLIALIIAMPLLVFVGDIVGVAASMVIADVQLGITGSTFLERLRAVMPPRTMIVGLIKAPVFAAFVAVIGCRMGFAVENNAQSVGTNTTSTVVQSIVSVILLNAAFAVIFVELKI